MRIALVADWLTVFGGAEHTIAEFHALWPDAPLFTTVTRRNRIGPLAKADIRTTGLQTAGWLLRRHQPLLPWMPKAVEYLDLRGYDIVLSSSHAVAKGVISPSHAVHICYCHTPMRYAWAMEEEYLDAFGVPSTLRPFAKRMLKSLRRWDLSTAKRVDIFLANSSETQDRICRIYGRESFVVSPPVQDRFFAFPIRALAERTFALAVGRLVPYKRFDLLIALANARKLPLKIVGTGREHTRLQSMAGPTVELLGYVPDDKLPELYASARVLLFPQHEDAGIVPLEAMASGTPVVAYDRGGVRDTIIPDETGVLFSEQSVECLGAALDHALSLSLDPVRLREYARGFGAPRFRARVREIVETTWEERRAKAPCPAC